MAGFSWVLIQKQRNLKYLLFFVPFLVFNIPTLLFSRIFIFVLPIIVVFVQAVSALFCVAGWILILYPSAKSKTKTN